MGAGGLPQIRMDAEGPQVAVLAGVVVQRERLSLIGFQEDLASPTLRRVASACGPGSGWVRNGDADRSYAWKEG